MLFAIARPMIPTLLISDPLPWRIRLAAIRSLGEQLSNVHSLVDRAGLDLFRT
jgi:hypothetical protein